MIAWYTNHTISQKIMTSIYRGWKIPAKNTDVFRDDSNSKEEAILYGILRGCADVMHHHFKNGVDYIHIDHGYLNEGHFDGYYRFSLNNTQAVYKDLDLPDDRAKKLDYKIEDWRDNKGGVFLILPPTAPIALFYGVDIQKWIQNIVNKIGDRPYKVRMKTDSIPFEEDLKSAKCVIAFNSNGLMKATLFGVPAMALSNYSVIRKWNNLTLNDLDDCLEKSKDLDRQKLINFCSYHQYTLDEVEQGIAPVLIKKMRELNVY